MSRANLLKLFEQADDVDREEGKLAYPRYHALMADISRHYGVALDRVIAGFVALSPNSDYVGNLRSLISCLEGLQAGRPVEEVTVSTYKHCRNRAWRYLTGEVDFMATVKGPKTRSFFTNVLNPLDRRAVTVDGHMVAGWLGERLTMKEAIVRTPAQYWRIAHDVMSIAGEFGLIPNQVQATIWFTRKRIFRIKFDPQGDVFAWADNDNWRTLINHRELKAYHGPRSSPDLPEAGVHRVRSGRDTHQYQFDHSADGWGLGSLPRGDVQLSAE